MVKFERPRGTRDFTPEEMHKRNYVKKIVCGVFESHGYREIMVPTFEHTELFEVKSGSDIRKHMYVFTDKGGRSLCLRPEATASVCRMFLDELRSRQPPLKLYYCCPMFRYDEPQKGRYREFWQIGVELIGSRTSESDAEVILLASESLKKLGLKFRLELNHLGVIRSLLSDLSEDSQNEILTSIDKKDYYKIKSILSDREDTLLKLIALEGNGRKAADEARELLKGREKALNALSELEAVLKWLDSTGTEYTIKFGVARGLEYYTGMVFEIRVEGLGAQNQICGGGRYDNLISVFGGADTPAVGFAFGFDRVVEAMESQGVSFPDYRVDVVVAPASEDMGKESWKIASDLRQRLSGRIVELDVMGRKLAKVLEYASNIKAKYVVIVGATELKDRKIVLRNMESREQSTVLIDELAGKLT